MPEVSSRCNKHCSDSSIVSFLIPCPPVIHHGGRVSNGLVLAIPIADADRPVRRQPTICFPFTRGCCSPCLPALPKLSVYKLQVLMEELDVWVVSADEMQISDVSSTN